MVCLSRYVMEFCRENRLYKHKAYKDDEAETHLKNKRI